MKHADGEVAVRHMTQTDAAALAAAVAPGETCALGPRPGPLTEGDAAELIAGFEPHRRARRQEAFAVVEQPSGRLLGCLTLQYQTPFMEPAGDEAEVAYWVRAEARGRGVATAALNWLSHRVLDEGPVAPGTARLTRLWLEIDPAHAASQRVAEKAGFVRLGTLPRALGGAATADHCLVYERKAVRR